MPKNQRLKTFQALFLLCFVMIFSFFISQEARALSCANVPLSGNYTATTTDLVIKSCTFSKSVDGVENGNLTIPSGATLTINANQTIVWNSGYSVIINGSIAINKEGGAQLRKTKIWLADVDNDGYPATTTSVAQDNQPAGWQRRSDTRFTSKFTYTASITYDYKDTDNLIYPSTTCAGTCSINNNDGTCGAKTAECLGTCQRCNGISLDAVYFTAGKVCSGGSEVAPTSGNKCDATIDCATNACSAGTWYRGCTAGATTCVDTGKVSGTAWSATAGSVINEIASGKVAVSCTQAVPTASLKCNTVLANNNNCQYTTYYRACGGAGTCYTDNTDAASAQITCAVNQATKGVTSCAAVTTSNYCQTLTNACNGTCKTMANYYGCASSGSTCEGTSRATSDVANCGSTTYCSAGSCIAGTCATCYDCASGSCTKLADTSCTPANNCTQTFDSGYTINKFTGSATWVVPCGVTQVAYLVVAGGGGGRNTNGNVASSGGGGGGGLLQGSTGVTPSQGYSVTVGAGGAGGYAGGNSSFSTIQSFGGGFGGWAVNGGAGGSGGGGGQGSAAIHGSGTSGQGYNGGDGYAGGYAVGGGGGAGEVGRTYYSPSCSGQGGNGTSSSITGSSVFYAGGGGGGAEWQNYQCPPFPTGGLGGGGDGAPFVISESHAGGNGTNDLGGGGGGSTRYAAGASGGSGVVIIRYLTP
jgi:hypothetical protein